MNVRARPTLLCLASAVLFGAATPASKRLLVGFGPLTLAGTLYLGAAAGVAPWALRGRRRLLGMDAANVRRLAASVVFGGIVGPALLLLGLREAAASSVSLWLTLEVFLTAVLARAFFREHLGLRGWIAVAAALAVNAAQALREGYGSWIAALLVMGACLAWAIDNNVTALLDGLTPAQTTFVKGAVAGVSNLVLARTLGGEAWTAGGGAVAAALLVGAVCFGGSIVLYVAGSQQLGAARSQTIFSSAPLFGALLAWTSLGETVASEQVVACAVLGLAIALMSADRHAHLHTHEPLTHVHAHRHDDGHHAHSHDGLPASTWHTHEHAHGAIVHEHPHHPDLHHRHRHSR